MNAKLPIFRKNAQALKEALSNLGSVFEESAPGSCPEASCGNALVVASTIVARSCKISIRPFKAGPDEPVTLDDIAGRSGFEVRRIELKKGWWQEPRRAFLAYETGAGSPVAVVPSAKGVYDIYDETGRRKGSVDGKNAGSLGRFAFAFYPGFGPGIVTLRGFMAVALHDCKKEFLYLFITGTLLACLGLALPVLMSIVFDVIIPNANIDYLAQLCAALLVCATASVAFQFVRTLITIRIDQKMTTSLNSAVWGRLICLPAGFFRKFSSGDLAARALGISVIQEKISSFFVNIVLALIFSLFYLLLLMYYNMQLALLMALVSFAYVLLTAMLISRFLSYSRVMCRTEGEIAGRLLEFFTGIEKIKAMAAENRAFSIWSAMFSANKKTALKTGKILRTLEVFGSAFPAVALTALFLWAAGRQQCSMTLGRFIGFINAFYCFQAILVQVVTSVFSCLDIKPVYERIRPILETLPEYDETKASPGELKGDVEVRGLTFGYSAAQPPALNNVCLSAAQGKFIAIVGPSGSGKSTLMRCLLGFETPASGDVYYDGQCLSALDKSKVRRQIGVVMQAGRLVPGDIFTNIAGSSGLTEEEAWKALETVGLKDEVAAMPMGIYTMIGSGLGDFSGGQRQRILIARAIARKPRILFFDEATSSLDNMKESEVYSGINAIQATKIVIAHRLNTVKRADWIYVFDKGSIAQAGRYDELISRDGLFSDLAKRQLL